LYASIRGTCESCVLSAPTISILTPFKKKIIKDPARKEKISFGDSIHHLTVGRPYMKLVLKNSFLTRRYKFS